MGKSYAEKIIPGSDIIPVTPGAGELPSGPCRALWIGVAGNVNITTIAEEERDDIPAQAGIFPISCTHVRTGASAIAASNIWAIY